MSERVIARPSTADGAAIWGVARDSGKLDLNSYHAYLLGCHDFADTRPPLTITDEELARGLDLLSDSAHAVCA